MLDFLGKPVDAKPYVEAIRRMSKLFAFASLLPVISRLRFSGWTKRHAKAQPKNDAKVDSASSSNSAESSEAPSDEPEPIQPLGLLPIILLAVSELSTSYDLFLPATKKKATSHPIHKLVDSVTDAAKKHLGDGTKKRRGGVVDTACGFITAVLTDDTNFATVNSVLQLGVLILTTAHLFQWCLSKRGVRTSFKKALGSGIFVAVACLFAGTHREILKKAWKALNETLPGAFWLPFRSLALMLASRPRDAESEDGTPPLFAALQIASLFAYISAELVTDELGVVTGFHKLFYHRELKYLVDNAAIAVLAPLCASVAWLLYAHVASTTGALLVSILLCTISSPVFLAAGWPKLAAVVGLAVKSRGPAMIIDIVSITYSIVLVLAILVGGTMSFIAIFMVSHLLIGTHGMDSFGLGALADSKPARSKKTR